MGIAVDATSGTFLLADAEGCPLTPGIMYNDLRAAAHAERAAEALQSRLKPYGIQIAAAFALPKILHLAATQPDVFARCRRVLHQTDLVVGMLCGRYDVTDISTALKTGGDPGTLAWPEAIEYELGIPRRLFPRIVLPGVQIGTVTPAAASATGLAPGTPVVAGCTDGTAGCLASGAAAPGDLNVTLGTTLVFKAVATAPLADPSGAVYNHRHPAGGFLPGAASSTGGAWIADHFGNADLDQLGARAVPLLPTRRIAYPLTQTGERFPFASPVARGFGLAEIASSAERFAAGMEGTAYVERLGVERFAVARATGEFNRLRDRRRGRGRHVAADSRLCDEADLRRARTAGVRGGSGRAGRVCLPRRFRSCGRNAGPHRPAHRARAAARGRLRGGVPEVQGGTATAEVRVSIFKACDIRGVAGSELNDQIACKIGRALGSPRGPKRRRTGDPSRRFPPQHARAEAGARGWPAGVRRDGDGCGAGAHAGRLFCRRSVGMRSRGDRHRLA